MYSVEASVLLIRTTAAAAVTDSLIPILSFDPPL